MDALGTSLPIVIKPVVTTPSPAPVLPKPAAPVLPMGGGDGGEFNPQVAEEKRYETVRRASEQVVDLFVVSDKTFTIFKDTSGQYITRFTSLRDGKVTYIPEPNLFRLGGENDTPTVEIKV